MKLIECPRDAMQGVTEFIPTAVKIAYLQRLLAVGFDTLDFGSFVSPKAIPQLRDTAEVLGGLDLSTTGTRLLAIVANVRGAGEAARYPAITYVGFPLSVSETFQRRNTNKAIAEALAEVAAIQEIVVRAGQQLVVYLSMGFGNPYGDAYSPAFVTEFTERLIRLGVSIIAPSDTVGTATPAAIEALFGELLPAFPNVEFGAHLHATPAGVEEKVAAVARAGIRRIDGALRGYGGCPMADDHLTGNLPTERIVAWLDQHGDVPTLHRENLAEALRYAEQVFAGTATA
jgi:hydroxymethylglutaryl-CoA lyase